jgi:hypothetical protein
MHDNRIERVRRDQNHQCVRLFQGFASNFAQLSLG